MLDFYFDSPVRRRQLRRGPVVKHLDGLAAEFQQAAYARNTARRHLSIIGQFSAYLGLLKVPITSIDEALANRFLAETYGADEVFPAGRAAMRQLLAYLRRHKLVAPRQAAAQHPFAATLEGFDRYLQDVRGLAPSTRRHGITLARAFLDWLGARHGDQALCRLAGVDVLEFVGDRVSRYPSRSSRAHVSSGMRAFLRYLHACGTTPDDLARAVPHVSTPRLARLPRSLPWEQVRGLIDAVDTSHSDGLRDKAILLLLATLGLRSGEVRALELSDLKWRAGEIRLRCTKTRRERVLPLLPEVGAALADYVLYGRPAVEVPQVFLRHGPRPGPIRTANTIVWIVRRHLQRAGVQQPRGGAHLLRHSLATRMVNAGVPIKSIADVLGHVSIDTTAIYAKVDTNTLAHVALPFPGGAQ